MVIGGIAVFFLFYYVRKHYPTPLAKEKEAGVASETAEETEETEKTDLPPITNLITFEDEKEEIQTQEEQEQEQEQEEQTQEAEK